MSESSLIRSLRGIRLNLRAPATQQSDDNTDLDHDELAARLAQADVDADEASAAVDQPVELSDSEAALAEIPQQAVSDDYWQQARRPLTSLAFVLPLLAIYEFGVLSLGPEAMRNGADVWLRQILDAIGFGQYFLLPILTVGILLGWHHVTGQSWRVSPVVLYGMLAECVVLACGMIVLAQIQGAVLQAIQSPSANFSLTASIGEEQPDRWSRVVSFSGAGIYEEVMFRLALLPITFGVLRSIVASKRLGKIGAMVLTSLVFSAAHYVGPMGQTFEIYSFGFRFLAGMIFSLLFVYRGFGIAAGTHAAYDIFVGVF